MVESMTIPYGKTVCIERALYHENVACHKPMSHTYPENLV